MSGGVDHLIMSGPVLLAMPVAAAAGAITFLSPCCLPLVPGYLSYLTGMSGSGAASRPPSLPARSALLPPQPQPRAADSAAGDAPPGPGRQAVGPVRVGFGADGGGVGAGPQPGHGSARCCSSWASQLCSLSRA